MPKEISSSYKGKDHKSDTPIHNVASPKKSRRYDATLSSEAYNYCLHQTRDHTSSQQEVGKPEQSMIVEKGSETHQYAMLPKHEILRLRGGADDYDDYGYGYGDPYDLGGYEDYGWHEDDAEWYRDYGWHEDNEERYREDEAYGNPSDQWKKDLASTSGMSAWERDQQTEVQYEWLEEGREKEAGERSKFHGDEKREEEDFEALRAEAMELIRQSEMKDGKREEEDFEALRAEAMELIRQSEMKDGKREEEDFEALRAEAMELIRQSEMKDGEVRQHDSGEYEDQEEVGQHNGGEHDGGQGDGNGGGDGGNRGVRDGSSDGNADAREIDEARKAFFDVLNVFTNQRLAEKERAERIEELAKDPAKGGTVEDKTRREAEVALQLEEIGLLAGPIRRDPTGDAEFIDRRGTLWDVKQFHSELGRFNLGEAVKTIRQEILAGENVILDTKFLDPNDAATLRYAIETNGWQSKILWSKDE